LNESEDDLVGGNPLDNELDLLPRLEGGS